MKASYLAEKFAAALPYDRYVKTGTDEQFRRWQTFYDSVKLTEEQRHLLASFARQMKVLIVSGIWCGDCVQQCPLLQRCAEANPGRIDLRLLDRDVHADLSSQLRLNGGDRVPVVLSLSEEHELCGIFGDRTLHRYRALAARQLGPSCPTGLVAPPADEVASTLQDWLDELERIQLMLRLSPRLRQKYND
jgi:hypothetical protein